MKAINNRESRSYTCPKSPTNIVRKNVGTVKIKDIIKKAKNGLPILGICNGFQILTESGLLPGTLIKNDCLSFICKIVSIRVENNQTSFSNKYKKNI